MVHDIIHLVVFALALVWVVVDLLTVNKKELDKKYKALYVENKLLLGAVFLAIIMMHIEDMCK